MLIRSCCQTMIMLMTFRWCSLSEMIQMKEFRDHFKEYNDQYVVIGGML